METGVFLGLNEVKATVEKKVQESSYEEEMKNTTNSVDESLELRMCYPKLAGTTVYGIHVYKHLRKENATTRARE